MPFRQSQYIVENPTVNQASESYSSPWEKDAPHSRQPENTEKQHLNRSYEGCKLFSFKFFK